MNADVKTNDRTYQVVQKSVPTFYFIGVTTGKSSIMKVFPLWMKVLGREEVVMEGVDCKIHGDPEAYRQAVAQIKYDPMSLGALVTTHKIDLLTAARDMFDYLDPYALITDEVRVSAHCVAADYLHNYPEARSHLISALAALDALPEDNANRRRRVEITLQLMDVSLSSDAPEEYIARLQKAEEGARRCCS